MQIKHRVPNIGYKTNGVILTLYYSQKTAQVSTLLRMSRPETTELWTARNILARKFCPTGIRSQDLWNPVEQDTDALTHCLLSNLLLAVAHITTSQVVFGRLEWAPKIQMTDSKTSAANGIWTPELPCRSRLYWHSATVTPSYKTHKTHHLNLFDLSSQLLHFLHVDVSLGVFLGASLRSRSHIIHDSLPPCYARFKVTHQLLLDVLQLGVSHLK